MKLAHAFVTLATLAAMASCGPDQSSRGSDPNAATAGEKTASKTSQGIKASPADADEERVPALAVTPDKPIPGKSGSWGKCPEGGYKYVPYTGTCVRPKR